MPGGNLCEENLEQRIERIRKRDEEIEKKHREAEADRLAALQANAMVKMTAPAEDDWPKAHKYDKLDFTYDVKDETADDDKKPTDDVQRPQRPFKKFPEGQGPPADPTYNFLADAERDGKMQTNTVPSENKNWRVNNNNSNSNNAAPINNRRNNANNSSFNRGRNGAKGKNPTQKGKPNDEPILRKNDRERNNEQRLQRQKSSDGMWRRTDDKKIDGKDVKSNIISSPTGKTDDTRQINVKNDASDSKGNIKLTLQQRLAQTKPEKLSGDLQQKLSDLSIEKRGNITVSVTKDGEVKSVKLEAARAIGTGRCGGEAMRQNIQQSHQQFVTSTPVIMDANLNAPPMNYYPIIDNFKPQHQHQPQLQATPALAPVAVPKPTTNIVNGVPFKLPSVQDRLIKNRVFFDGNLKNVAQTGNGSPVAGNE